MSTTSTRAMAVRDAAMRDDEINTARMHTHAQSQTVPEQRSCFRLTEHSPEARAATNSNHSTKQIIEQIIKLTEPWLGMAYVNSMAGCKQLSFVYFERFLKTPWMFLVTSRRSPGGFLAPSAVSTICYLSCHNHHTTYFMKYVTYSPQHITFSM